MSWCLQGSQYNHMGSFDHINKLRNIRLIDLYENQITLCFRGDNKIWCKDNCNIITNPTTSQEAYEN